MQSNWKSYLELPSTAGREANNITATLENSLAVPQKVEHRINTLTHYSHLGIYQREMKTCPHKELYAILITRNNPDVLNVSM